MTPLAEALALFDELYTLGWRCRALRRGGAGEAEAEGAGGDWLEGSEVQLMLNGGAGRAWGPETPHWHCKAPEKCALEGLAVNSASRMI